MNSQIKEQGNTTLIEGGTRAGTNLFHSLKELSVSENRTILFENLSEIQNIFVIVTGSSVSDIDGLLRANGTANLFLINSNGIIFGKNGSLDIGGSFFASTASSLKFSDGSEFSTASSSISLLSASIPTGMEFARDTVGIKVEGNSSLAEQPQLLSPLTLGVKTSGLSVKRGKTLGLIGGKITLDGATLTAEDGQIELGSFSNGSFVSLMQIDEGWALGYEKASLKDIELSQGALVDVSGVYGGSIQVQGAHIKLTGGSVFLIQNLGNQENKSLKVNATESLDLSGSTPCGRIVSSLRTSTVAVKDQNFANEPSETQQFGIGKAADIVVSSKFLNLREGATIGSVTNNAANGGNVVLKISESSEVAGFLSGNRNNRSNIFAVTTNGSSGKAGDISISTRTLTAAPAFLTN